MTLTAAQSAEIDQGALVLMQLLKLGVMAQPALAFALPVINMFINYEAAKLKSGLATGELTMGPQGIISKEWAADPRHQLDADGNFVDRNLL
jgi:hypothetical protein